MTAIKNIGKYLARAVKDGSDLEAREGVAFANNLSGQVMTVSCCTSEHSMEHAMSAYHQELHPGENTSNEWLEPVSDEDYNKLK